jgi:hypothetical protein
MKNSLEHANSQADAYDNIAPTSVQGQQAWQYAQSDSFLSPEELTAVLRRELAPYRSQIEEKLASIGYPPQHLAKYPELEDGLYCGKKTGLMDIYIAPGVVIEGRFRVGLTENGPEIFVTPYHRQLTIPDEVNGIRLSERDKQDLIQERSILKPFLLSDKGDSVPTYLRVDEQTNTVELWRVRPEMLPTKLMGVDLTRDQQLQLAHGHAIRLHGLTDRQGEPFDATVCISATRKELQFSDFNRLSVNLKPDNDFRQQLALNDEGIKTDLTRSREIRSGGQITSNHQDETLSKKQEYDTDHVQRRPSQHIS